MSIAGASEMATIHGAIYEWDTFEPLENVIVEVNSTPPQSMLAKEGLYSFNLAPGDYLIVASSYDEKIVVSYAEEEISITDNGDYVLDLILLPAYMRGDLNDSDFAELEDIAALADEAKSGKDLTIPVALIVVVIAAFAGYIYLERRKKDDRNAHDEYPEYDHKDPSLKEEYNSLPDDLQEVITILSVAGGRMTQKDLRTKVKHSEAKVSLMISDLENRGIVRKFRKGRGNVIILEDTHESESYEAVDEPN